MLSATVRALYSAPGAIASTSARAGDGAAVARSTHVPACLAVARSRGSFEVHRPSGTEYEVGPLDAYRVDETTLRIWLHDGLDAVADVEVRVLADTSRGLIRALKDLYDPRVGIVLEGRRLERWFDLDESFRHRALVVEMTGGVDGPPVSIDDRRIVAGLLFKDDDIQYDLAKVGVELPPDLNAPVGSEIFVWDGQTLIWRMHPVARERHGDAFAAITATVVACRQAIDGLLDRIRALDVAHPDSPDERLQSLVTAQTLLEREVQARLDLLAVGVGRASAAHLESLVRQTGLQERMRSVADLLDRSRRTIELELSVRERRLNARTAASAADVRTVVVVFAVVSAVLGIVAMVIDLGGLPEPDDARIPRLPTVIALAVLVSLGAAAVAVVVLFAAQRSLEEVNLRRVRTLTACSMLGGGAGLVWVIAEPLVWVLVASVVLVVATVALVALQLRLAGDPA